MKLLVFVAGVTVAIFSGCSSVPVTPGNLAAIRVRTEERDNALKRWDEAVRLCNAFLASPYRSTLPEGTLQLTDEGMVFVTGDAVLPVRVRCTRWGDLVVATSYTAQERSDGFVVGLMSPKRDRLLDNSFFKDPQGQPLSSSVMAELTLHELTHSYCRVGTVSYIKALRYYAEAVFLFRYRNHSMERLPNKTTAEFWTFFLSRSKERAAIHNHPKQSNKSLQATRGGVSSSASRFTLVGLACLTDIGR